MIISLLITTQEKMKKVITVGVFDYFHIGHLRLFEQARKLGDYLIVAVQNEEGIKWTKPEAKIFYTMKQRIDLVKSLRVVDEVMIYQNVDELLPKVEFDIFAIGEDQSHEGFQRAIKYCEDKGKTVVRLKRTPGICSSQIKSDIMSLK